MIADAFPMEGKWVEIDKKFRLYVDTELTYEDPADETYTNH